jgi:PTH1 family peptidyl-tRNA hydrolase
MLRPGDLVLLKGTHQDELHRLLTAGLEQSALSDSFTGGVVAAEPSSGESPLAPKPASSTILSSSKEASASSATNGQQDGRYRVLPGLEAERKALRSRMHALYSRRNALFKEIGAVKRGGTGDVATLKAQAAELSTELDRLAEVLEEVQRRIDGPTRTPKHEAEPAWVVGLGNPAEALRNTPHNVGQAVVDILARHLKGDWIEERQSLLSQVNWNGRPVLLIKPLTPMNNTGPVVRELAQRRGLLPDHAILVHDDVALPLGTVRTRTKGTDGGHRGVRSILEAFETDAFARVKVGVATSSRVREVMEGVLTPFTADEMQLIAQAYPAASKSVLELAANCRLKSAPKC